MNLKIKSLDYNVLDFEALRLAIELHFTRAGIVAIFDGSQEKNCPKIRRWKFIINTLPALDMIHDTHTIFGLENSFICIFDNSHLKNVPELIQILNEVTEEVFGPDVFEDEKRTPLSELSKEDLEIISADDEYDRRKDGFYL